MMGLTVADCSHLFLSLACLLLLARGVTSFLGCVNLPAVLGEILLGIFLGPTLLGTLFPTVSKWLLPIDGSVGSAFQLIIRMVVILLLFVAGMETNLSAIRTEGRKVLWIALGSALLPFVAGLLLALGFPALFGIVSGQPFLFGSFVGIAFAISALPVIIRILMDLGLYHSKVGTITVAAASLMDLWGWMAFTIILSNFKPTTIQDSVGMLWSHMTLLSFLVGILLGNSSHVPKKAQKLAYGIVIPFLSPLFFLSIGAKVNFAANWQVPLIASIIFLATFSKIAGTFVAGRLNGLSDKEALAVGFALNARGAMEIILSEKALEVGLIQPPLFVALVIMALFTSFLGGPAVKHLSRKSTE